MFTFLIFLNSAVSWTWAHKLLIDDWSSWQSSCVFAPSPILPRPVELTGIPLLPAPPTPLLKLPRPTIGLTQIDGRCEYSRRKLQICGGEKLEKNSDSIRLHGNDENIAIEPQHVISLFPMIIPRTAVCIAIWQFFHFPPPATGAHASVRALPSAAVIYWSYTSEKHFARTWFIKTIVFLWLITQWERKR